MEYQIDLPTFSGPLELLLHLVQKEQVSIYDIPIARITDQYLQYLAALQELDLNVAADFLVLAATLLAIKARMLLPKPPPLGNEEGEEEEDPRAELVARLIAYRRFKEASGELAGLLAAQNLCFDPVRTVDAELASPPPEPMGGDLTALLLAFGAVLAGLETVEPTHTVRPERFSVDTKIAELSERVRRAGYLVFDELFTDLRQRDEVVATFLAVLELVHLGTLAVRQERPGGRLELIATAPETRHDPLREVEP